MSISTIAIVLLVAIGIVALAGIAFGLVAYFTVRDDWKEYKRRTGLD